MAVPNPLTLRQQEILTLLKEGYLYKQIAIKLHPPCSKHTVLRNLREVYMKLNATNRTHAVIIAIRKGYISLHDTGI